MSASHLILAAGCVLAMCLGGCNDDGNQPNDRKREGAPPPANGTPSNDPVPATPNNRNGGGASSDPAAPTPTTPDGTPQPNLPPNSNPPRSSSNPSDNQSVPGPAGGPTPKRSAAATGTLDPLDGRSSAPPATTPAR